MGAVIVGFEAKLLVAEFRFIKECKEPVTAATFNAMYQEFEDHVNRSKFSEEDKCFLLYAALPPSNRPQLRYLNQMTDGMAQVEFSELAPMKFRMYDMLPAILEAIIAGKAALAKPAEAWGSGVKRQKAEDNPQQPRYNHPSGNSNVSQAVPPSLQNRAAHRVNTMQHQQQSPPGPPPGRPSFNPPRDVPLADKYDTPRNSSDSVWIKGVPVHQRKIRRDQYICEACNVKGHHVEGCNQRFDLYKNGELFFFPWHYDPNHPSHRR
jgi:hypothetical protein